MAKIRLHIDPKGIGKKPTEREWGRISQRVLKSTSIEEVTILQLVQKIRNGHTICPAVLDGSKATDWKEQQIFMVDIDNADKSQPLLSENQALEICNEHGLSPTICYQTFSHSESCPKFRLVFVMNTPVTASNTRRMVMERLISIFPQSDKACSNANRIFLGTNMSVSCFAKTGKTTVEDVLAIRTPQPCPNEHTELQDFRNDPQLDMQIHNFDFLSYLAERNGPYTESGTTISFQNCEVCGHKNDLRYYRDTNTFYCFSSSGEVGGSIIDYLMVTEGLTSGQAIDKFSNELCQPEWYDPERLEEHRLPSFPIKQLPQNLRNYVTAVAENTATRLLRKTQQLLLICPQSLLWP